MSKKRTKAQIIEDDDRIKMGQQSRMKTRGQLSDLCRNYLEKKELFKWFIEKYYGLQKYMDLWELAEHDQEYDLRLELEEMWYSLPDNIFNLQNNPPGWEAFVDLIDE